MLGGCSSPALSWTFFKGITFDTGGLNLKPTNFIETMHYDMVGAHAPARRAPFPARLRLMPCPCVGDYFSRAAPRLCLPAWMRLASWA